MFMAASVAEGADENRCLFLSAHPGECRDPDREFSASQREPHLDPGIRRGERMKETAPIPSPA
jgi:hypothetical protein